MILSNTLAVFNKSARKSLIDFLLEKFDRLLTEVRSFRDYMSFPYLYLRIARSRIEKVACFFCSCNAVDTKTIPIGAMKVTCGVKITMIKPLSLAARWKMQTALETSRSQNCCLTKLVLSDCY